MNRLQIALLSVSLILLAGCGKQAVQDTEECSAPDKPVAYYEPGDPPVNLSTELELTTLTIHWDEYTAGDYNGDATVSGLDIFPIAANFGLNSNWNGHTADNELTDCIDGNRDGVVNGMDLFLVSTSFQDHVDGFNVYESDARTGPWTKLNINPVVRIGGSSQPPCFPSWEYEVGEAPAGEKWYSVTAVRTGEYAGESDYSSPVSLSNLTWVLETVDAGPNDVGRFLDMELSFTGQPFISYQDFTVGALKVAHLEGENWVLETVPGTGKPDTTAIAVDSLGKVLVAYPNFGLLRVALWDGLSWQITEVDAGPNIDWFVSVEFDSVDAPGISYYDTAEGDLWYAESDGLLWSTHNVDSGSLNYVGLKNTLAFDSLRNPHIVYSDVTDTEVKYAVRNGENWSVSTLDIPTSSVTEASFALDSNDNPAIAFPDSSTSALGVSWYREDDWQYVSFTGPEAPVGYSNSVAFDSNDNPGISFRGGSGLHFAYFDGSDWTVELIDDEGDVGWYSHLEFDSDDHPMIAHYDNSNKVLRFAWLR